jgi:hypothetical protein
MPCFFAFTDACPQESIDVLGAPVWHTMAAIGTVLPESPFASGLVVPTLRGIATVVRIPDPQALASSLQSDAGVAFRSGKKTRGKERRRRAVDQLLSACDAGRYWFLSHSTLSHLVDGIADRYLNGYCTGFVRRQGLVGQPDYVVSCPPHGKQVFLSRQRMVSLTWVAHCLLLFHKKACEAAGNVEAMFVHDNLPFDRDEEAAVLGALLHREDPGRIHFMTEQNDFEFAPTDNLAALANDCIAGRDSAIQQWVLKGGRPRNFYMTMDEEDGSFTRFI